MNVPPQFYESVGQALAGPESLESLRTLAIRQLARGTSRETLASWFEQAREKFPTHEDRLLEVLDLVVDWCSPNQKLEEPLDGRAREGESVPDLPVFDNGVELIPLRPISEARGMLPGIDTTLEREPDRL